MPWTDGWRRPGVDSLVEQIRALDGFADFLRPPRLEALLPAAAHGPIAVVNLSHLRCDALVVDTGGVRVVELPGLTIETVVDRTSSTWWCCGTWTSPPTRCKRRGSATRT